MPAFSVTPLTDVPPPQAADFPDFIQFQANGTDLGLADADTLNFSTGLTATRGTGENSNVVTVVAASAGGASYGLIELTTAPEIMATFDGSLFNFWTANTVITNADWSFATGFLQFLTAGVYRVIATCMVEAGGAAWPEGNSIYGSQIDTVPSSHERSSVLYDATETTAFVRWTDQHVVQIATADTTVECALYALNTQTTYAIASFSMTLVIERLGDYPA